MILESIVTTINAAGLLNVAPMGPRVEGNVASDDFQQIRFTLRPFAGSRTCANLMETRKAVIHVTDDVELFARAAVGAIDPDWLNAAVHPIDGDGWRVLDDCHRWFAVSVESIVGEPPRWDLHCRVDHSGVVRPFFGFNRAKHAVIEAAILATRTHLLDSNELTRQLTALQPLVEKTAGPKEQAAFEFLRQLINQRTAGQMPAADPR